MPKRKPPTLRDALERLSATLGLRDEAVLSTLAGDAGGAHGAAPADWQALATALRSLFSRLTAAQRAVVTEYTEIPVLLGDDAGISGYPGALKYYPEEAREFVRSGEVLKSYDADVIGWWRQRDGAMYFCHAHPEGFWCNRTPGDFVAAQLDAVKRNVAAARKSGRWTEAPAPAPGGSKSAAAGPGRVNPRAVKAPPPAKARSPKGTARSPKGTARSRS